MNFYWLRPFAASGFPRFSSSKAGTIATIPARRYWDGNSAVAGAGLLVSPDSREAPPCMRCRGLTGVLTMPLTCRLLSRVSSWPDPPPDFAGSAVCPVARPSRFRRVASPGSRHQVVNDFYCLSPRPRKGFLLSISRFFFASTRNRLLSPDVGPYPPSIHKDVHSLGVALCGGCPR